MRGLWRCDDLTALLRIFVRNREALEALDGGWSALSKPLLKVFHALQREQPREAAPATSPRTTIWATVLPLFLDETMVYSRGSSSTRAARCTRLRSPSSMPRAASSCSARPIISRDRHWLGRPRAPRRTTSAAA